MLQNNVVFSFDERIVLLARHCIQRSALGTEHSSRHFRLSVRRCEQWPHTWMDWDAVWGGERVVLGSGVLDFGGDRRRGRGSLGVNTMQKWRIDRLLTRV